MLSIWIAKIHSNYARLRMQSEGVKASYRLFQDLKQITLDRFIDAYCNDNLRALVIDGEPPREEIEQVWDELQTAYIEIIGGDEVQDKLKLIRDVNMLSMKVERIGALLDVLSVAPTEGLFMQLYEFGYSLPTMTYSEDAIKALSKVITAHMKRDVVEVQILSDRIKKETGESKKMSESDFYNIIVEISDMFKVVLNEKETSVMAFAMYVRKYKERAEKQTKPKIHD